MPFLPFSILGVWFRGLLAIAILAACGYLAYRWYHESHVVTTVIPRTGAGEWARDLDEQPPVDRKGVVVREFRFQPGPNRPTAFLASAVLLLVWATGGGWIRRKALGLNSASRNEIESDRPREERTGSTHQITRPDGSVLKVESYGPIDGQPIILTHGWGCDSTEWFYQKQSLAGRFRLIVWDEPGLGESKKPTNNDYSMENLARDLAAVIELTGGRRPILVGHSIGGMIILTLCKIAPEFVADRVAGLVLAHTTYRNPVRTTRMAWLYSAIEKPVLVPLLYLTIALWPIAWLMNWLSYLNGSAHQSTHRQSFAGGETASQLDFFAKFMPKSRPDVLARGMLGMLGYDSTAALGQIPLPTLVIVGDRDTTTLPDAGEYIRSRIPHARLETLSPAKHLGLIEHHGTFNGLLESFATAQQW